MAFNFEYFKKFDFGAVLEFATIGLFRQKNILKEGAFLALLVFLVFLLFGLFAFALIFATYLFITPELTMYLIIPLIFSVVFFVLFIWASVYFSYKVLSFALSCLKKKSVEFSFDLAIRLILTGIFSFLVALFSLYELKLLLIGVIGFILFLCGLGFIIFFYNNAVLFIFGILFVFISLFLIFIYYVIIVRNSVRISFSSLALVEKDLGVNEAVKYSWNMSAGKAVLIFFIQLILGGIMWVLQQIIFIPLNFISIPFTFAIENSSLWILMIPIVIIFVIIFIGITAISELVVVFGVAKTYSQITQTGLNSLNKRK